MAIKISGTTVIDDSRTLLNVIGLKTVSGQSILGSGDIATSGNYAMQVFTTPGTWTKPATVRAVKVIVVGGGGASGNSVPGAVSWPGGGGGGAAIEYLSASEIPGPVAVTVGNGGLTTNPAALSGNTSSFGSFCSATGGTTGRAGSSTAGAAGGTGTGGTYNIPGEPGRITTSGSLVFAYGYSIPIPSPQGGPQPAFSNIPGTVAQTGNGGRSILGDGGSGSIGADTGTNNNPSPDVGISARAGTGYGAGASGQFLTGTAGSTTANGTAGIVIVEEFY